ncbi:PCMD domain-containing protein, partial [uncultured Muribaculum sp.]
RYSITIVFASSIDGDLFEGAPESTLLIDEVELGCQ